MHTLPAAGVAGISDHLPGSTAIGAFRHLREASEGCPGRPPHLTGSSAGTAGGGAATRLGSATTAGVTGFEMGDLDLLFLTEDRLLEIDREVVAEVIPMLRSATSGATTGRTPGASEALEKGLKQVGEAAHVPHIGSTGRSP